VYREYSTCPTHPGKNPCMSRVALFGYGQQFQRACKSTPESVTLYGDMGTHIKSARWTSCFIWHCPRYEWSTREDGEPLSSLGYDDEATLQSPPMSQGPMYKAPQKPVARVVGVRRPEKDLEFDPEEFLRQMYTDPSSFGESPRCPIHCQEFMTQRTVQTRFGQDYSIHVNRQA